MLEASNERVRETIWVCVILSFVGMPLTWGAKGQPAATMPALNPRVIDVMGDADVKYRLDAYSVELYKRIKQQGTTVSLFVTLAAPYEEAIGVLFDSHAGSNQKMDAIGVLARNAYAANSPEGQRVVGALVRQAHFDSDAVREKSRTTLANIVGEAEAKRLISAPYPAADFVPAPANFFVDFARALGGLKGGEKIASDLGGNRSEWRQKAIKSLAELALEDRALLASLDEPLKARLLAHLDDFDRMEPDMRLHTLLLLEQLGPTREGAVVILSRALADDDAEVRKIIARFYSAEPQRPEHQAVVAAIATGLVGVDQRVAKGAARYLPAAPDDSMKMAIAQAVAAAAIRGDHDFAGLISKYGIKLVMLAQAAHAMLNTHVLGDWQRLAILKTLRAAGADAELDDEPAFRELAAELLARNDDTLSVDAAAFCTTAKSRAMALETMIGLIREGKNISPALLKALKLDAEAFGGRAVKILLDGNADARRAAAHALAIVGVKGDATRAAIEPMLRDRDAETRKNAAKILDTPQAAARARMPELLNEIRAGALSARHLAARQIDELGIEPREVTGALVRAVEEGDFAARQGLVSAMETANFSSRNPLVLLKEYARAENRDAALRAYARAALREVDAAGAGTVKP